MELAYVTIRTDELLKEITKWHILQYLQYPNVFLEKLCIDKNIDKLKWLLTDKLITINLLDEFVKNTFTQNYDDFYNQPNYSEHEEFIINIEMNTFINYILFVKKCPKMLVYIYNTFSDVKKDFILLLESAVRQPSGSNKFQQYLKTYFSKEDLEIMNINFKPIIPYKYDTKIGIKVIDENIDPSLFEKNDLATIFRESENVMFYLPWNGCYGYDKNRWLYDNKQLNAKLKNEQNDNGGFITGLNNNDKPDYLSSFYDNNTKTRLNNFGEFINLMPIKMSTNSRFTIPEYLGMDWNDDDIPIRRNYVRLPDDFNINDLIDVDIPNQNIYVN